MSELGEGGASEDLSEEYLRGVADCARLFMDAAQQGCNVATMSYDLLESAEEMRKVHFKDRFVIDPAHYVKQICTT